MLCAFDFFYYIFFLLLRASEHAQSFTTLKWIDWENANNDFKKMYKNHDSTEKKRNVFECQLSNISKPTTTKLNLRLFFIRRRSYFLTFAVHRNYMTEQAVTATLPKQKVNSFLAWLYIRSSCIPSSSAFFIHWMYLLQCIALKAKPDSR